MTSANPRCATQQASRGSILPLCDLFAKTNISDGEILSEVSYLAGRFGDAIAAIADFPDKIPEITSEVAATYAQAGRMEEAQTLRVQFEETRPECDTFQDRLPSIMHLCAYEPERERWLKG